MEQTISPPLNFWFTPTIIRLADTQERNSEIFVAIRIQQQNEPECHCNCVGFYRDTIRLRKRIFEVYLKEKGFSEAEAMAVLVCMQVAGSRADEALARLAGLGDNNISGAFRAPSRQREHKEESESDRYLWKILSDLQFKGCRGRRLKGRTLVLFLDTILLLWCRRGYLHLLRDNLSLRLEEYAQKGRAVRKLDRWEWFWKAVKAAEISSRRIWIALLSEPPEHPPADWWLKVACQKGFTAESMHPLAF
jgi:hypothetical protein